MFIALCHSALEREEIGMERSAHKTDYDEEVGQRTPADPRFPHGTRYFNRLARRAYLCVLPNDERGGVESFLGMGGVLYYAASRVATYIYDCFGCQ
jgi:hypothetical protein